MPSDIRMGMLLSLGLLGISDAHAAREPWTQVPCYASKGFSVLGLLGVGLTVTALAQDAKDGCHGGSEVSTAREPRSTNCVQAQDETDNDRTVILWSLGLLGTGGLLHLAFSCSDPVR